MQLSKKILSALILSLILLNNAHADTMKIPRCDELLEQYQTGTLKSTWFDMYEDEIYWEDIRDKFHKEMDKRFEEIIKDITKGKKIKKCSNCDIEQTSSDSLENAGFVDFALEEKEKPPRGVLLETQEYQCVLFLTLQSPTMISEKNSEISSEWTGEMSTLFMRHKMIKDEIAQEIETVGIAIRIALDSLSEMQMAYVIHRRLECLTFCLEETRDALKDYFEQLVRIPGKFLNCGYEA